MMNWSDTPPDWTTPIGEKIDRFFQAVAERFPGYSETIVVFGSATIHLRLDPSFNSADADLRVTAGDILLCPHAWHLQMSGAITDFRRNLEDLWPVLYHKPLDVKEQIIRPLLHELELSGYEESQDWHSLVRALAPVRP